MTRGAATILTTIRIDCKMTSFLKTTAFCLKHFLPQKELENMSKMEYCPLCGCEFTAPVVARAHYAGKKHAKKLKEKADFEGKISLRLDFKSYLQSFAQIHQRLPQLNALQQPAA